MTERFEAFGHLSAADRERLYVNVVVPEAIARRAAQHMEELDVDYRKSPICAEGGSGPELSAVHRPRPREIGLRHRRL